MKTSLSQTGSEKKRINRQLEELISNCTNCTEESKTRIRKASDFANHAHMGVRRKSGEPYIFHPLAVAMIVVKEIGLGEDAICAALLHDVVEDTDYTVEDIRFSFGDKIAELVDGLTKIEGVFDKTQSRQAENFKKILLTLMTDINVILIKLADRLHNMRTLDAMPERKQFQIASETFYLFAPLADRLGFYKIKTEMEDLSLKYFEPTAYREIKEKIDRKEIESETFIDNFEIPIIAKLKEAEIEFVISSRFKSVYSIWRKMQNKNVPFEEVYDLFAIRIVFKPNSNLPERTQCWAIYSLVTEIYRPKLERLRDWVGTPKTNGYEALHCTLMGPDGVWVEVQIKTERMDDIAEKGIAAHWKYKMSGQSKKEFDDWLQQVRENLMDSQENAETLVSSFKTTLLQPEIYVFTPKGEQRKLPKGATVLDFAYDIHTQIGNRAIAAKVNYKLVPLNHVLKSTDQVEIITTRTQKPKKEWIDFVTTVKAKNLIKSALKSEIKEHSKKGKEIIDKKLADLGIQPSARTYRKLIEGYRQTNKDELFSNVGAGLLTLDSFNKVIRENTPQKWVQYWSMQLGLGGRSKIKNLRKIVEEKQQQEKAGKINPKSTYLLKDDLSYKIAECCKPIPGDEIIGFTDSATSVVTVHKKKCETAIKLAAQHAEKMIKAQWSVHKILSFLAILEIRGIDRLGILRDLTDIIADRLNVNIRKLNIESHDGIFEGFIELYVHDLDDLNKLINTVQQIKGMDSVKRVEKLDSEMNR
ncbi:MAG: RelA/SpoT family protein [Prevotellaceae bacterium]|jgi:GTP pyrophosphokinase|nr:RelA/SpoT family protein [Prevotellaceae bacterium]